MKKIIFLFALLLSIVVSAQDFPGKRPQLLLGKEVKVLPIKKLMEDGYTGFYADSRMSKRYMMNGKFNTAPEAVSGKSYKVLSVDTEKDGPYTVNKLTLQNVEDQSLIYFKYDEEFETYCFEVKGGLELPDDFYKDYVEFETDKVNGTKMTSYDIRYLASLIKSVKGKFTFYYLTLEAAPGDNDKGKGKGATIVLENGQRIEKPLQVVKVCGNHYCTMIELKEADIKLLKENKITDYKVNTYSEALTPLQAKLLQGTLNYMVTAASKPAVSKPVAAETLECEGLKLRIAEGKYETPSVNGIKLSKAKEGNLDVYIATISLFSKTQKKGTSAAILFADGSLISRSDAKVLEGKPKNGQYEYTAMFMVTKEEMVYFKNSPVEGIQVIDTSQVTEKSAEIKKMATCLIQM